MFLETIAKNIDKHSMQHILQKKLCSYFLPEWYREDKKSPSSENIQKTGKKHIEDLLWKRSIVEKAAEFQKDIIPVHIHGFNSKRFYNVGYYRKKVFIEANLEMFYLPDELFTQRGNTIHFEIGKPIPGTHFDNSKSSSEWVQWLKEHVYSLSSK